MIGAYDCCFTGGNGGAYVFALDEDTEEWVEEQKLVASDGDSNDLFGAWVAIDGDSIAVSAPGNDDLGTDSGSVYLFRLNPADDVWFQQQS